ncbi:MAG: V-type ATP synthase subunit E [Anaerohalosphaeraceae bacterium]|nr:V-type ATP synthase subunit E [Anaerohalosphaeraceae bacterium]
MSANEVVEKILASAEAEAGKIKAEADSKAAELSSQTDSELADFDKETALLKTKAFEEAKSRILAAARMAQAKNVLQIKKGILDEIFANAANMIKNMNDSDYPTLMGKLLKACIETGDEKVIIGRDDNRLGDDFIKYVNAELGNKGKLTLADEKANIDAGFVLLRGSVRVNASLEVLIAQAREKLEIELAGELFN